MKEEEKNTIIDALNEAEKMFSEKDKYRLDTGSSRENPLYFFVSPWVYDYIKKIDYKQIDEEDIFCDAYWGYVKVIKVENKQTTTIDTSNFSNWRKQNDSSQTIKELCNGIISPASLGLNNDSPNFEKPKRLKKIENKEIKSLEKVIKKANRWDNKLKKRRKK